MFDRRVIENFDWMLFFVTLLLVILGLLNLYSATYREEVTELSKTFTTQFFWVVFALICCIIATTFDYRLLERLAWPIYILNVGLLIYVLFQGKVIYGSQRWIHFGFLNLQPSEMMKITLIITLAKYYQGYENPEGYTLKEIIKPFLVTLVPAILILKEPDLGTTLLLFMIFFGITVFVGLRLKSIITIIISVLITIPIVWLFLLKEYQKERIRVFLDPGEDKLGNAWHITQSIIAVGSGKMFGKGFLEGTQSKLEFVPKQHTDFIFSVFAEEWGFVGCIILLLLFLILLFLGIQIAAKAKERFSAVLAVGIVALLFVQISVNICMELNLMPVVGVTLPFFSYGGSSMVTTFLSIGLLLNISMRRHLF